MIARGNPPGSDWKDWLQSLSARPKAQLESDQLKTGDHLMVVTEHTTYHFVWLGGPELSVELLAGRPDRPSGRIKLHGCTFGASSSIASGLIFTGGNLEFSYLRDGKKVLFTTTAIREIRHLRHSANVRQ